MTHRIPLALAFLLAPLAARAADLGTVPVFEVFELALSGPKLGPADTPARDVELEVTFRHESGSPEVQVHGFWDGDGKGGSRGSVFRVRFTPTAPGRWTVARTRSNAGELAGEHEGDTVATTASAHPGFWIADGRWYRRSNGSRPFITGNTHYSFLSRRNHEGDIACDPIADVRANARFYRKLRFALTPDRYPDPEVKPFLDAEGRPSDDGRYSLRPNPAWFHGRVDPVVLEGYQRDLACDLILCGPDTKASRSTLAGDPAPWLRYVAARYGSYPNVWFCLANEWDIKDPSYTAEEIRARGDLLRSFLAYPTPVSVHGKPRAWNPALNGSWHDHVTIQYKARDIASAADAVAAAFAAGAGKPVLNDETAYQGDGDRFPLDDVMAGCLGTFLGGGYPTTGEKYGNKLGQYFWGGFDARAHSASERLHLLRDYVEREVTFWRLEPAPLEASPFSGLPAGSRLLARAGEEYVIGSERGTEAARAALPPGAWDVHQLDLLSASSRRIAWQVSGAFTFSVPDSRAVLTHFRRVRDPMERSPADLILTGGRIVTSGERFRIHEALAVRDGVIVGIGSSAEVLRLRGENTGVVDLEGRCVLPGLIDSHVHAVGASLHEFDHPIPEMETIAAVLDYVRGRAEALGEGRWIRVRQVFITRLREERYPTRAELDEAAPRNPVIFSTGPDASLNSLALELSGIDRDFEVTDGGAGYAEKDPETGEPTGILRGSTRYVPYKSPAREPTAEEKLSRLRSLLEDYRASGLTSIADRNAGAGDIELYRNLEERGELPVRVFLSHGVSTSGTAEEGAERIRKVAQHPLVRRHPMLRIGGIKVFLDGGMLTGSAYMREPWGTSEIYSIDDPEYRGVRFIPQGTLDALVEAATESGLQFTAHSVGDGAVHALLDAYRGVSRRRPIRPVRPCITHSNFMSREAIDTMVELGVGADIQPAWLYLDTRTLVKQFGYERLRWFQPLRSIFAAGALAGGGSDHMQKIGSLRSVNPYNPFLGMWTAITRRARWYDGELHPEEALSREQAISFYTIQNARLLLQDDITGSLEPGKRADFIVLDRDILTCPVDEVREVRVLESYLDGRRS